MGHPLLSATLGIILTTLTASPSPIFLAPSGTDGQSLHPVGSSCRFGGEAIWQGSQRPVFRRVLRYCIHGAEGDYAQVYPECVREGVVDEQLSEEQRGEQVGDGQGQEDETEG